MIIINTKNYKTGDELLKLARLIEKYDVHTIIAVPAADLARISSKSVLNVYAQHVDVVDGEKSTGWISAGSVRANGGSGTLVNHSEHPLKMEQIKKTIEQCKKARIASVVCAKSLDEVRKIATFKPSAIAFEDPKLISTGKSITKYQPKILEKFVQVLKGKPVVPICGAGISSADDVKMALEIGCEGVLIASAIAASKRPEFLLEDIQKLMAQRL